MCERSVWCWSQLHSHKWGWSHKWQGKKKSVISFDRVGHLTRALSAGPRPVDHVFDYLKTGPRGQTQAPKQSNNGRVCWRLGTATACKWDKIKYDNFLPDKKRYQFKTIDFPQLSLYDVWPCDPLHTVSIHYKWTQQIWVLAKFYLIYFWFGYYRVLWDATEIIGLQFNTIITLVTVIFEHTTASNDCIYSIHSYFFSWTSES